MEEESSRPTRTTAKDAESKIGNASLQAQGEFFKTLQDMSRDWMECAAGELQSGFKLSNNLISAHSVPDAITAYREWLSEEMDARVKDAMRLMSDGQKFMDSSIRLLSVRPGGSA